MVQIVGLAEIDGVVLLKIDGAGRDQSDLWLRVIVADVGLDLL